MQMQKQVIDFNATFRAYEDTLINKITEKVFDKIKILFSPQREKDEDQRIKPKLSRRSLYRVEQNEPGSASTLKVKCPNCEDKECYLNKIGFHLRGCARSKGQHFIFNKITKNLINPNCSCGKKGVRLHTKLSWPSGVASSQKSLKAVYIHHLFLQKGQDYITENFNFKCLSCSMQEAGTNRHRSAA